MNGKILRNIKFTKTESGRNIKLTKTEQNNY